MGSNQEQAAIALSIIWIFYYHSKLHYSLKNTGVGKRKTRLFLIHISKKGSSFCLTHSYLHRNDIKTTSLTSLAAQLTPAEAVITRKYQSIFTSERLLKEPSLRSAGKLPLSHGQEGEWQDKADFCRIWGEVGLHTSIQQKYVRGEVRQREKEAEIPK